MKKFKICMFIDRIRRKLVYVCLGSMLLLSACGEQNKDEFHTEAKSENLSENQIEEYLETSVPELIDYKQFIEKQSNGEAHLIVESDFSLLKIGDRRFYPVYVGEQWDDHRVNWEWFYVSGQMDEILWYDLVDDEYYSLEEWRNSKEYRTLDDCLTIMEKSCKQQENGFDIEIHYPELKGMEDVEKEERINQLIEVEAKRLIPQERDIPDEWIDDGYITCVFLDYDVKFVNNNIISILYEGMDGCMVKGLDGAVMASTIDLQAEEVIKLSNVVTDMEQLYSWLLEDRFQNITLWDGTAGSDLISEEYKGERRNLLMDALTETSNEHPFVEWYTDGMNLVIMSKSPYGANEYSEYAESLESIEEVISQEFLNKLD